MVDSGNQGISTDDGFHHAVASEFSHALDVAVAHFVLQLKVGGRLDETRTFLERLQKTVSELGKILWEAPEFLSTIPIADLDSSDAKSMTLVELEHLMSSLHVSNAIALDLIKKSMLVPDDHSDVAADIPLAPSSSWELGLPLERVVEADNETDRTGIRASEDSAFGLGSPRQSSSSLQAWSMLFSRSNQNISSAPAETDGINVPAVEQAIMEDHSLSDSKSFLFANDDDMDTLEGVFNLSKSHVLRDTDNSSSRVTFDVGSRDSTEDTLLGPNDPDVPFPPRVLEDVSAAEMEGHDDSSEEPTTVCPTIVAKESGGKNVLLTAGKDLVSRVDLDASYGPPDVVEAGSQSPTPTFLTLDATHLNDITNISMKRRSGYDVTSLGEVTPVLDRYRLDIDDSSVGLKVVPNERGQRSTGGSKRDQSPDSVPETILTHPRSIDVIQQTRNRKKESVPGNSKVNNSAVSFDKVTPLIYNSDDIVSGGSENSSFNQRRHNNSLGVHSKMAKQELFPSSINENSVDIPAMSREKSISANGSGFASYTSPTSPIQKCDSFETESMAYFEAPSTLMRRRTDFACALSSSGAISKITTAEFKNAPESIRIYATMDEVNAAISAFNGASLLRKDCSSALFTDTEVYRVLRNCGFKRRRCKVLLESLCHWKRLVRHDDPDGGAYEVTSQGTNRNKSYPITPLHSKTTCT